jgi:hypothetical protein
VVSFTPRGKDPPTHWIGDWVDPRAGLNDVEKRIFLTLPGLELRPLGHPACSQLLLTGRSMISSVSLKKNVIQHGQENLQDSAYTRSFAQKRPHINYMMKIKFGDYIPW